MNSRRIHRYLGVFFAPSIVFFALTGLLQTFNLHEDDQGGSYRAPAWVKVMSALHKDQTLVPHGPPPFAGAPDGHDRAPPPDRPPPPEERPNWALKTFVAALAAGLTGTACLGVVIAVRSKATRLASLVALGLGIVTPLLLLLF